MNRKTAIKTILDQLEGTEPVVSSTGLISRQIFDFEDKPNHFYMTGSLGLVSSVGLGVAINNPSVPTVVLDGDASLLMNLGSLATIGKANPDNLLHVVLDNNAFCSCSNEESVSDAAPLNQLATTCGYNQAVRVNSEKLLKEKFQGFLRKIGEEGPVLLVVEINTEGRRDLPRPLNLPQVASKFIQYLKNV